MDTRLVVYDFRTVNLLNMYVRICMYVLIIIFWHLRSLSVDESQSYVYFVRYVYLCVCV